MSGIEQVIRPYTDQDVTPDAYIAPGIVDVPPVRVTVGLKGGTKFFTTASSFSMSTRMGAVHKETAPSSKALQSNMSSVAASDAATGQNSGDYSGQNYQGDPSTNAGYGGGGLNIQ